jgi:hypothetical protein
MARAARRSDARSRQTRVRAADAASSAIVRTEPHPALFASRTAYTRSDSPAVMLTAPATSKWRRSPSERLSPISIGATAAAITPIGTLTQSTHSQPRPSVSTPPSSTPTRRPNIESALAARRASHSRRGPPRRRPGRAARASPASPRPRRGGRGSCGFGPRPCPARKRHGPSRGRAHRDPRSE